MLLFIFGNYFFVFYILDYWWWYETCLRKNSLNASSSSFRLCLHHLIDSGENDPYFNSSHSQIFGIIWKFPKPWWSNLSKNSKIDSIMEVFGESLLIIVISVIRHNISLALDHTIPVPGSLRTTWWMPGHACCLAWCEFPVKRYFSVCNLKYLTKLWILANVSFENFFPHFFQNAEWEAWKLFYEKWLLDEWEYKYKGESLFCP